MKASLRWGILNLSKILFKIRKGVTSPHPTVKNLSISSQNFQRISTLKSFYERLRRRQINKTDNKFNSENQIETNFCCQVQCAQMDRLFHQCLAIYSMETLHNRIINCQRSSIIAKYFWKVQNFAKSGQTAVNHKIVFYRKETLTRSKHLINC